MIPMNAEVRQAFLDWKKKQDEDKKKYRKKYKNKFYAAENHMLPLL